MRGQHNHYHAQVTRILTLGVETAAFKCAAPVKWASMIQAAHAWRALLEVNAMGALFMFHSLIKLPRQWLRLLYNLVTMVQFRHYLP